jgi:cholestenol delta-isomerase
MFRRLTGPWTASLFPSDFWRCTALQLAHDEPAIWHAAVAVGMLHQKEGSSAAEHHLLAALGRDAEIHYNKAMRLAREMTSAPRLVALCMLLVAAANMLDHWAQAQTHLLSGLKITAADTSEDPTLKDLRDSLVRLDLQSMTFSESSCPYPYAQSADAFSTDSFLATLSFHQDTSYAQLSSELFGMNRALFLLEDASIMDEGRHGPWLNKFEMFTRILTRWELKVADFEAKLPQQSDHFVSRLALRLHHAMLRLMIQAVGPGPETKFDAMVGVFEYMVRLTATLLREIAHSASPSFEHGQSTFSGVTLSLEPGVIVPLWVVIHNCRHHGLRHTALNLLRNANRIEGMWKSSQAAKVLEAVVAVEEENIQGPGFAVYQPVLFDSSHPMLPFDRWQSVHRSLNSSLSWENVPHIPEAARVKFILARADHERGVAVLNLMMSSGGDPSIPLPVKEVVVNV